MLHLNLGALIKYVAPYLWSKDLETFCLTLTSALQEVGPDEGHMYNCHVILSNKGEIKAAYRKVHLFDVDVPNGPILMESRSTAPGKEVHP